MTALVVLREEVIRRCSPPANMPNRRTNRTIRQQSIIITNIFESECEACLPRWQWSHKDRQSLFILSCKLLSWPRSPCLCAELSGLKVAMNIKRQQKQTKRVVEHKGKYPKLGSEAVIDLQTQSLTWDTLCAQGSQISLVGVHLQLIQQLAWDTLAHLRITTNIPGISNNFLVCPCDPPAGALLAEYFANSAEIPVADSGDPPSQKNLSRCGFLVAYKVEGLKMSDVTGQEGQRLRRPQVTISGRRSGGAIQE
jgi:hypothetical protein